MKNLIKDIINLRKNNLPTPFWDEERQTLEYVYFYNGKSVINSKESKNELEVHRSLADALGEIVCTGLYYPYTTRYIESWLENDKLIRKSVVGHFILIPSKK